MSKPSRPPGPSTLAFVWSLLKPGRASNLEALRDYQRRYGDIVWLHAPGFHMYLVSHPAYIKHFLVDNAVNNYPKLLLNQRGIVMGHALSTSDGAYWKRHRRMVQTAFLRERVNAVVPRMAGEIHRVLDRHWEPRVRSGEPLELLREMSRLSVSVLLQLTCSESPSDELGDAVFSFLRGSLLEVSNVLARAPLPRPLSRRLKTWRRPDFFPAAYRLDAFAREMVARRLKLPEQPDDMLGQMIKARDDKGEGLSELELRDELVDLFYGGHISTGIGLSWMYYCLGQHPEVAERMRDEVERTLGGRSPETADLKGLQYVSQVFDETLRLYPPAHGLIRIATQQDTLAGHDVPPGTQLMASAYVMHRLPEFWARPESFHPEHFSAEQVQKRPRFVYLAFGGGQRVCVGSHLASLIATVLATVLTQRYRLELVSERSVRHVANGTFHPSNLWVKVLPARAAAAPARLAVVA